MFEYDVDTVFFFLLLFVLFVHLVLWFVRECHWLGTSVFCSLGFCYLPLPYDPTCLGSTWRIFTGSYLPKVWCLYMGTRFYMPHPSRVRPLRSLSFRLMTWGSQFLWNANCEVPHRGLSKVICWQKILFQSLFVFLCNETIVTMVTVKFHVFHVTVVDLSFAYM